MKNPVLYFTIEVGSKITSIGAHILPGPKKCKLQGFFRQKEYFNIEVGLKLTSIGAHILPCSEDANYQGFLGRKNALLLKWVCKLPALVHS